MKMIQKGLFSNQLPCWSVVLHASHGNYDHIIHDSPAIMNICTFVAKSAIWFSKMRGGVKGRLDFFRKFILWARRPPLAWWPIQTNTFSNLEKYILQLWHTFCNYGKYTLQIRQIYIANTTNIYCKYDKSNCFIFANILCNYDTYIL